MNPFMQTFTDPPIACWHDVNLAPNSMLYAIARTQPDWTLVFNAFAGKQVQPRISGYDLIAHPHTWAELGAYNLARAYRPEGLA